MDGEMFLVSLVCGRRRVDEDEVVLYVTDT